MYVFVCVVVPAEARGMYDIPLDLVVSCLMWVPGGKLRPSGRVVHALKHLANPAATRVNLNRIRNAHRAVVPFSSPATHSRHRGPHNRAGF